MFWTSEREKVGKQFLEEFGANSNPNIVSVFECRVTRSSPGGHIYIDMEVCEATLETWIANTKDPYDLQFWWGKEIRKIMLHVTNGADFIHKKDLCHRDLKPSNSNSRPGLLSDLYSPLFRN